MANEDEGGTDSDTGEVSPGGDLWEVQKSIEGVRDPEMRAILKGLLASLSPQPDKLASVPSWMQPIVRQIAGGYLGEDHD